MSPNISICLEASHWQELGPHLPRGLCTKLGRDEGFPMLDCRMVVNEAEYQTVVQTVQKHCPKLVRLIEKQQQLPSRS
jgi:hypothetical protein